MMSVVTQKLGSELGVDGVVEQAARHVTENFLITAS